ncbi:MAG: UDP-N-acetylmuramoyl-tripeptide--D-alanyl-D-alanine ligase [Prevotella sp.]|nr:UDP-N-acetylmuramoyl-tripeptide--D-alanyl-D-alanine ligase [Prevotella sp.]MDE6012765.1 UDP-N-acetylmuramoyl-tripeptide--D-alanyl-D-alanine ligase [Prevotella sp.]
MDIKELYKLYLQHPCITTDSRDCPKGSIFLALKGTSFDGNLFAKAALEKGCAYAIVDNAEMANDKRIILVEDTLQTYKDLAREHRRQFNIPVIGITGTNGKTTTKELIKAVLSEKFNVLATEGNFNNDIGVPKTLFRLTKEHEIAIIEMGASHPGDIKTLVETAEPTCGLITNVGRAHLQGFGSFEGVIKTKGELYDYLRSREDGLTFINADNDYLVDMLTDDMWCTPYSTDPEKQYSCISGEVISCDPLLKFRWRKPIMELEETGASQKWHKVQTNLIGAYNIDNLLAAIAVGINFGVDRKQIDHALESYVPTNNRSQLVQTASNRLIVDAYNANPSSMAAALENFQMMEVHKDETKMAILGDMRELGEASEEEHQKTVDLLAATGMQNVWLVGEEFGKTHSNYRKFKNVDEVKAEIEKTHPIGHLILIKGSNGTKLFQLPELL